jgi:hypothetical protein
VHEEGKPPSRAQVVLVGEPVVVHAKLELVEVVELAGLLVRDTVGEEVPEPPEPPPPDAPDVDELKSCAQ